MKRTKYTKVMEIESEAFFWFPIALITSLLFVSFVVFVPFPHDCVVAARMLYAVDMNEAKSIR